MSLSDESIQSPKLHELQRWVQAVITHPCGVVYGAASPEARRGIAAGPEALEKVVPPSPTLSGAQRLAIYSRSYHARLLQCLEESFPALLCALGGELFRRFAQDYLQQNPPSSYSLERLADAFPDHLAKTRPDAQAPERERELWPDFIIGLATLELAFAEIYDGPGLEGRPLPLVRDLLSAAPEQLLKARPEPAPCLRLFAFSHPVHVYMLAARRGESPELPAPSRSLLAVTRRDYRVRLYELSARQHALLEALDGRRTVGQALNEMADPHERARTTAATARRWLCDWTAKGFFEGLNLYS